VPQPVFYQGKVCGEIRKYSDRMLELLLRSHRPEKYRDRQELTGKDSDPIQTTGVLVVPGMMDPDEWAQMVRKRHDAMMAMEAEYRRELEDRSTRVTGSDHP
jgi:hypothetical protein